MEGKGFSLWTLLTTAAFVGSTAAGAGWVAGRTYLQDEISQYKASEQWKIPDAIQKITTLSGNLDNKLDKINDYELLKEKINNSKETIEKLEKDFASSKERIDQLTQIQDKNLQSYKANLDIKVQELVVLKSQLESLRGEYIKVFEGNAESVGHKSIKVGVYSISAYSNYASVNCGEYSNTTMRPGDNFAKVIDNKKYVITLVNVQNKYVQFSYDIFDNK